jgi:hypothetical protein
LHIFSYAGPGVKLKTTVGRASEDDDDDDDDVEATDDLDLEED